MKITIDKGHTTLALLPKVKEDAKEFKSCYTDADLLSAFSSAVEFTGTWGHDILSCNVEAFPGGTDYNNETHYHVSIITHGFREFCEISFYCDSALSVDTRDLLDYLGRPYNGKKMYEVRTYKEV